MGQSVPQPVEPLGQPLGHRPAGEAGRPGHLLVGPAVEVAQPERNAEPVGEPAELLPQHPEHVRPVDGGERVLRVPGRGRQFRPAAAGGGAADAEGHPVRNPVQPAGERPAVVEHAGPAGESVRSTSHWFGFSRCRSAGCPRIFNASVFHHPRSAGLYAHPLTTPVSCGSRRNAHASGSFATSVPFVPSVTASRSRYCLTSPGHHAGPALSSSAAPPTTRVVNVGFIFASSSRAASPRSPAAAAAAL